MNFLGFHEGLDDHSEDQVKEKELTDDDNGEKIEGTEDRDVDIHEVLELIVPSLTHDHLKDCQERSPKMLIISHCESEIGPFFILLTLIRYLWVIFDVPAKLIGRALKIAQPRH